ncbi:MAG: hypothetical protein D6702_04565 [Planctomycetota bacterium]|nr:MAG: hypothetical protein D6702_04565 [Planctomycetota bacterium]
MKKLMTTWIILVLVLLTGRIEAGTTTSTPSVAASAIFGGGGSPSITGHVGAPLERPRLLSMRNRR